MKWLKDEDLCRNRYSILWLCVALLISFFYFFSSETYKYSGIERQNDTERFSENFINSMANINCSIDHDGCHTDVPSNTINVKTY